jgi:threonine aldolase
VVQAAELARAKGLKVHLDGARLFNAQVASGLPLATLCQPFDSVSLCCSKGLGAPVGSLVLGSAAFIRQARRTRKILGGGMRQAGVLAAAGHYALDHHVERLAQDHAVARQLAAGLATIPGLRVEVPQTNIVFVDVDQRVPEAKAKGLLEHLRGLGILATGLYRLRFVAHLDVGPDDADRTVEALRAYLQN